MKKKFIFSGTERLSSAETDGNGNLIQRYIYGNDIDEIVLASQNNTNYWVLQDRIGSITGSLNDQGTILGQGNYNEYGVPMSSITTGITFGYAGMKWDNDARLYYVRNRWYNPTLGRFISPDYIQSSLKNRYNYAENSPIRFKDTNGLTPKSFEESTTWRTYKLATDISVRFSKAQISNFLKNNPKIIGTDAQLRFDGIEQQLEFNYNKLPQIQRFTTYNTAFKTISYGTFGLSALDFGIDTLRHNNGDISNFDYSLKATKFGINTGLTGMSAFKVPAAGPVGAVWSSAQIGWQTGRLLGQQSISTDLSMTYDQFYQQQFTQFYVNQDNKKNQYTIHNLIIIRDGYLLNQTSPKMKF